MENYIKINGQKIALTDDQVKQILAAHAKQPCKLGDLAVGDTCKIGEHEMVVLEHVGDTTALIRKDILGKMAFGSDNNFIGSDAQKACEAFADELAAAIGEGNIVCHDVDLTSDDGLDSLGKAAGCRASLLTAQMYRSYVRILDKHKVDKWWWLATAFSVPPHDHDNLVKCVSPSGYINIAGYSDFNSGVRPFCILKSNIFVSE